MSGGNLTPGSTGYGISTPRSNDWSSFGASARLVLNDEGSGTEEYDYENSDSGNEEVFRMDNIEGELNNVPINKGPLSISTYVNSEAQDPTVVVTHQMLENFAESKEKKMPLPIGFSLYQQRYFLDTMEAMGMRLDRRNNETFVVKSKAVRSLVRHIDLGKFSSEKLVETCERLRKKAPKPSLNLSRVVDKPQYSGKLGGVLMCGDMRVPPPARANKYKEHRESLPIFKYKEKIVKMVRENQFSVIRGPSGVGKSTQIPQYIMEDCMKRKLPCRILVCLPERICAIALCDRIALERDEPVGHAIGYHVQLETCFSPVESIVNFCTGSLLIRALSFPGKFLLHTISHIILDEMHCRSKHQDFLLMTLRDLGSSYKDLKVVCVSEPLYMEWLPAYLCEPPCPEILVEACEPPKQSEVKYLNSLLGMCHQSADGEIISVYIPKYSPPSDVMFENARKYNIDDMIKNVFSQEKVDENIHDFLLLVRNGEVDPNYAHPDTGVTMLMSCAANGLLDDVKQLLECGADILRTSKIGLNALQWAESFKQNETAACLVAAVKEDRLNRTRGPEFRLLQEYLRRCDPETIDYELILNLTKYLHVTDPENGSILIFLPTYENLEVLYSELLKNCLKWSSVGIAVHLLHKHVQTGDERAIFEPDELGFRKVILSTAISQSSMTFEDVKFVIDTGRERAPYANFVEGKPLSWISQADAEQRRLRLGRTFTNAICYRLYTEKKFMDSMKATTPAQIQQTNLLSLCLQSRALLRNEITIATFFKYFPQPPNPMHVDDAVRVLKSMGAIENNEQMTELGFHLLDFPIDPRWAKAALYSCIFKCMDPILTLAAYMSYEDAFIMPKHPKKRQLALQRRLILSDGTLSDYTAILKAFHKWELERASRKGDVSKFCKDNYIMGSTFDVVYEIRTRLLGQLRASGFVKNKGVYDVKDLNEYSNNWAVVKAVLAMSLYPNVCIARRTLDAFYDGLISCIQPHFSSVLSPEVLNTQWKHVIPTDFVVYERKLTKATKSPGQVAVSITGCCAVNFATVLLLAGELGGEFESYEIRTTSSNSVSKPGGSNKACVDLDGWISFFGDDPALKLIQSFRERIKFMILRRLTRPDAFPSEIETAVLDCVVAVITAEDTRIGFKSLDVSQWPKLLAGNLLSAPKGGYQCATSGPGASEGTSDDG